MKNLLLKSWAILSDESGQDLIEYALVAALIAFGAVLGMKGLAQNINTAFDNIGDTLVQAIPAAPAGS